MGTLTSVFVSLTALALLSVIDASSNTSYPTCRCTSDQDCWPTQSDFETLALEVSQPIIYPVPPASACYPTSSPSGNCSEVMLGWADGSWRSNQSGSMDYTNFETFTYSNGTIEACYLNTTLGYSCEQGSVPVIGVDARSPEDIQAAVKFASKHNLRVVIKNTGHDLLGRSTARGSFLIWTHNLKNITFHETFVPDGGNSSVAYDNVFTLESGVQWHEAYAAAQTQDRVLVGGFDAGGSIGSAGGWVQGGGHSLLSPNYGLGVDNVLQMTVVTVDGSYLTVNAYNHPDLFWALRGGGGGTFGVLTSVTYRSHPSTPFAGCFFVANRTELNYTNPNATQNILTELIHMTPSLVDQGFGGYVFTESSNIFLFLLSPNATWGEANDTWNPLFDYAWSQAESGGLTITNSTLFYDSFTDWYEPFFGASNSSLLGGGDQVGVNVEITSWLLPEEVITSDPEHLSEKLMELPGIAYCLIAGGAVSRVNPDSTGLNPAWRNALAYTFMEISWPDGTSSADIDALRTDFKSNMAKLESIAPDSGAYFNEASMYEFDWKKSFFGSHYDNLKVIKDKYDPSGLFVVWEGVGSDDWDSSLNCRV